jgi:hypothetical protein
MTDAKTQELAEIYQCIDETCKFEGDVEALEDHVADHRKTWIGVYGSANMAQMPYYCQWSIYGLPSKEPVAESESETDDEIPDLAESESETAYVDRKRIEEFKTLATHQVQDNQFIHAFHQLTLQTFQMFANPANGFISDEKKLANVVTRSLESAEAKHKRETDAWKPVDVANLETAVEKLPDGKSKECFCCGEPTLHGLRCRIKLHEMCRVCIQKQILARKKHRLGTETEMVCPLCGVCIKLV